VKEFFKKHKLAVLGTGGVLLVLWLYYRYEQDQANNAANSAENADDLASALTAASLPSIYGGGSSIPTLTSSGTLDNYTGTCYDDNGNPIACPTSTTPASTTTTASNGSTPTPTPSGTTPTSTGTTGGTASPGTVAPNPVPTSLAGLSGNALASAAATLQSQSYCQFPINGMMIDPNLPNCADTPQNVPPQVAGLEPGQAGYTSALQGEIASATAQGETGEAASLQAVLAAYGGLDATPGETENVPAGSTSTTPAPPSSATRPTGGIFNSVNGVGIPTSPTQLQKVAKSVLGGNGTNGVTKIPVSLPAPVLVGNPQPSTGTSISGLPKPIAVTPQPIIKSATTLKKATGRAGAA
jgi:hypothetical protein